MDTALRSFLVVWHSGHSLQCQTWNNKKGLQRRKYTLTHGTLVAVELGRMPLDPQPRETGDWLGTEEKVNLHKTKGLVRMTA